MSFLLGADVGHSFNQAQPSGIDVNFSCSVATAVYQITPVFSFMLPVQMLYVTGVGWIPLVEAGVIVNLKNPRRRRSNGRPFNAASLTRDGESGGHGCRGVLGQHDCGRSGRSRPYPCCGNAIEGARLIDRNRLD